jgi:hypothetical protein
MLRFMKLNGQTRFLVAHDWKGFARGYNGKEYWKYGYDTKIAKAYQSWVAKLRRNPSTSGVASNLSAAEIETVQKNLKEAGYPVGKIDGVPATVTDGAILDFQANNGLELTGVPDPATLQKLAVAPPRPIGKARANASIADLRRKGSQTIALTDWLKKLAIGTGIVGALGATQLFGATSDPTPSPPPVAVSSPAASTADVAAPRPLESLVGVARGLFDTTGGLGLLTLGGGVLAWRNANQIARRRLRDHRIGVNLGK